MPARQVKISAVSVPKSRQLGVYANAFRVVQDSPEEFLLDFVVYSDSEKVAEVVGRVRVHANMLPAIRDSLAATLQDLTAKNTPEPKKGPVVVFQAKPDGEVN